MSWDDQVRVNFLVPGRVTDGIAGNACINLPVAYRARASGINANVVPRFHVVRGKYRGMEIPWASLVLANLLLTRIFRNIVSRAFNFQVFILSSWLG
ncbi:MAG: hypothetical protein ACTSUE_05640 [Promethearchaeota archaeon]